MLWPLPLQTTFVMFPDSDGNSMRFGPVLMPRLSSSRRQLPALESTPEELPHCPFLGSGPLTHYPFLVALDAPLRGGCRTRRSSARAHGATRKTGGRRNRRSHGQTSQTAGSLPGRSMTPPTEGGTAESSLSVD